MTTVLSIKSKDGIVLASDSQGTASKIKLAMKKVFKINSHLGIAASGDSSQIELFVEELEQNFQNQIESELDFKTQMYSCMVNLHRIYNFNHSFLCGYGAARLFFTPFSLVAGTPRKGNSFVYRIGFGTTGKNNEVSPYLYKINVAYATIGSGSTYARLVLSQQERLYTALNSKLSDLSEEHIVGIASYVINEVKQLDLETGGKTQIAIVSGDGLKELSYEEQTKCNHIMDDNLLTSLNENFSNKEKATEIVRFLFPHE